MFFNNDTNIGQIRKTVSKIILILLLFGISLEVYAKTGKNDISDTEMRKSPYLLYEGINTEYLIMWQLNTTRKSLLKWGKDTTYTEGNVETTEFGNDHQHKYLFTNLTPGTKYYYDVIVNNVEYKGNFNSAPADSTESVKFVAYGDSRSYPERHDKVAKQILNLFASEPEYQSIVAFVGDVAKRGTEAYWTSDFFNPEYKNIKKMLGSAGYQIAIGNHEDDGKILNKYYPYNFVKNNYWAFDYGPVRFIMLDQYLSSYDSGSEQLTWFENELKKTEKKWKVVVMHKVGYSAGYHGSDQKTIETILPLCEKYGVRLMFGGHNHLYARAVVNGVYCITTGGATSIEKEEYADTNAPYIEKTAHENHFCKIDIQKDKLFFEAVDISGNVLDNFIISLNETIFGLNTEALGPGKIEKTPDSASYHSGTEVLLKAVPDSGCVFDGWSGDLNGITNPVKIIIDKNKNIKARFHNPAKGIIDSKVSSGSDDAEERISNGKVYLNSTDLELVVESSEQLVGMRFNNILIPQGTTITNAYIQFTTDEIKTGDCSLTFKAEANDNPATFTSAQKNISTRPTTTASVNWTPSDWQIVGESGNKQRTPELKKIIQEIVNRSGWSSGNSIVIIVSGKGTRTAESYDGSSSDAPKLHIEYSNVSAINRKKKETIPKKYYLSQNYPNPFNPTTVINYGIPESGMVSIKIYNVLGQEIKTLLNKFESAGNHQINFCAKNLPSGVYIYSVRFNNSVLSKKMLLSK